MTPEQEKAAQEYREARAAAAPTKVEVVSGRSAASENAPILVRVVDVDISFGQMIFLMIKMAFASIPAVILIAIISAILFVVFSAVFGGVFSRGGSP